MIMGKKGYTPGQSVYPLCNGSESMKRLILCSKTSVKNKTGETHYVIIYVSIIEN